VDIRGSSLEMGRQTTVGLSTTTIFSAYTGHIFGTFTDKAIIIYSDTEPLVGFPWTQNTDLEWPWRPFFVKFCFYASMLCLRDCGFRRQLRANE